MTSTNRDDKVDKITAKEKSANEHDEKDEDNAEEWDACENQEKDETKTNDQIDCKEQALTTQASAAPIAAFPPTPGRQQPVLHPPYSPPFGSYFPYPSQFHPPPPTTLSPHHYVDHAGTADSAEAFEQLHTNRGGVIEPFPEKLHRMLDWCEREGMADVVSFFSHGRAFAIHKPRRFVEDVMPLFFKGSKLQSFQRQLNLYGFKRISQGPDNGGYYHELFLKGRPALCVNMKRIKLKGENKFKKDPDNEPNFYAYPPVSPPVSPPAKASNTFSPCLPPPPCGYNPLYPPPYYPMQPPMPSSTSPPQPSSYGAWPSYGYPSYPYTAVPPQPPQQKKFPQPSPVQTTNMAKYQEHEESPASRASKNGVDAQEEEYYEE